MCSGPTKLSFSCKAITCDNEYRPCEPCPFNKKKCAKYNCTADGTSQQRSENECKEETHCNKRCQTAYHKCDQECKELKHEPAIAIEPKMCTQCTSVFCGDCESGCSKGRKERCRQMFAKANTEEAKIQEAAATTNEEG